MGTGHFQKLPVPEEMMYLFALVLFMLVLPVGSIAAELFLLRSSSGVIVLIGKWFVFWAVGARQLLAGVRQTIRPELTSDAIFGIKGRKPFPIVQELGFANLSMGALGLASIASQGLVHASATVSGLFFGLAGIRHLLREKKTSAQQIATVSDLGLFAVLVCYLIAMAITR